MESTKLVESLSYNPRLILNYKNNPKNTIFNISFNWTGVMMRKLTLRSLAVRNSSECKRQDLNQFPEFKESIFFFFSFWVCLKREVVKKQMPSVWKSYVGTVGCLLNHCREHFQKIRKEKY